MIRRYRGWRQHDHPAVPVDEGCFRRTLGHFCTGVAVIATAIDGQPAGFTCQSLTSLSLDPPLVTFAAAATSRTLPRILRAGTFCASILSVQQEALCRRFASTDGDRFDGVDWFVAPRTGSPRLTGAIAWVDALLDGVAAGGDHVIVIGRAVDVTYAARGDEPLLFYRGEMHRLGVLPLQSSAPGVTAAPTHGSPYGRTPG
jgi:3-hydroxy-9,10-secoandrosta-1,3,5(10)-triene-9,17-dione monooxygenase reductase component